MHLFGFAKKTKTKKRPSSGQLRLGLRKVKSTGNIASDDSDSSLDSRSDNSDTENIPSGQHQKSLVPSTSPKPPQSKQLQALKPALKKAESVPNPSRSADEALVVSKEDARGLDKTQTLTTRCNEGVDPNDLDALLSMETQQRLDAQTERDKLESSLPPTPRPTRLKFELPVTPSRSRSPSNQPIAYPRARPYRSLSEERVASVNRKQPDDAKSSGPRKQRHKRWSKLMGSDSDDETCSTHDKVRAKRQVEVGTYVRLLKRPLPTMGYVRYIGPVEGEPGDWIGVELQHRVGNCDGLIKGQRFFKTDPQRGIFLKPYDVEAVI
ncbi:hypothetical protein [Absidia glauca]|uniref:CAP-Gly domain-containing protein n=1 Tax=Absidia glauca TaxID=4829 RepID=A0A163KHH7_ABSGL|nr:hypothetical protein [Absidia glauca]